MNRVRVSREFCYVLGVILLALGTAFMERAGFGLSMVVAPAYLIHLKLSEVFSFFSFGMAEYVLQLFVILLMCFVLGRFKVSYLFSFVTAVFYGLVLDGFISLFSFFPSFIWVRVILFLVGFAISSSGVSLLFNTYLAPGAYELFVKEVSSKFGVDIAKFKIGYDLTSCFIAIILSFCFFGFGVFRGVSLGTVFCAFTNGILIAFFSRILLKFFVFYDSFPKIEGFFAKF